ncbi:MAG TPA: hypothetical protein VGC54_15240 [Planctomycetota bacterium]
MRVAPLWIAACALASAPLVAQEAWPADWQAVLRGAGGRDLARAMAHRGLPIDADWPALARLVSGHPDPLVPALVAAGALAPARVSGRPELTAAARRPAVAALLEVALRSPNDADLDLVSQRIRPWLQAEDLEQVLAFLASGADGNSHRAGSLLLAAPHRTGRPFVLRALLNGQVDPVLQPLLVARLLRADGRAGLEALAPRLEPGSPEALMRWIVQGWAPLVDPAQDSTRLARLVGEAPPGVAGIALRLLAEHERGDDARLQIFTAGLAQPEEPRRQVLEALARRGPHAGIARRLMSAADAPGAELQSLAFAFLPSFEPVDDLVEAYTARLEAQSGPLAGATWAEQLARLDLPASGERAAQWLAEGGWEAGARAGHVARLLRERPEIDPWLERLLRQDLAPQALLLTLATGRAAGNDAAAAWLRSRAGAGLGGRLEPMLRALARGGRREDLRLIEDLAVDGGIAAITRAAAIGALGAHPDGGPRLARLAWNPPRDYEIAEALVRAMIAREEDELRTEGLALAADGGGFDDESLRAGLRLAAWQVQREHPRAAEATALAGELGGLLAVQPGASAPDLGAPPAEPRRQAGENAAVYACAAALAASVRLADADAAAARAELAASRPAGDADPWLLAAGLLADGPLADRAQTWCAALAADSRRHPATRLRAAASRVRAAWSVGPAAAAAALDDLLAAPARLLADPRELDYGLADPAARGWVLPIDRLVEQRLVARAAAVHGAERRDLLRALVTGGAGTSHRLDAAELLLDDLAAAEDAAAPSPHEVLALELAAAAVEAAPTTARARFVLGKALLAKGDRIGAAAGYSAAVRLAPPGGPLALAAQAALDGLPTSGE